VVRCQLSVLHYHGQTKFAFVRATLVCCWDLILHDITDKQTHLVRATTVAY
jgi:hypothetical protein